MGQCACSPSNRPRRLVNQYGPSRFSRQAPNCSRRPSKEKVEPSEANYCGDAEAANAMVGFRRSFQFAELITTTRLLLDRALEWGETAMMAQIDFARAYDSVRHGAVLESMRTRKVPRALSAAYLRELRRSEFVFENGMWRPEKVAPKIGLSCRRPCFVGSQPMCLHNCRRNGGRKDTGSRRARTYSKSSHVPMTLEWWANMRRN